MGLYWVYLGLGGLWGYIGFTWGLGVGGVILGYLEAWGSVVLYSFDVGFEGRWGGRTIQLTVDDTSI